MAEAKKEEYPMIYRSIAGVIADVGAVGKDKENKQQGFKFRSIDDVYNALHPALAKNKVVIVPNILSREVNELQTARGTVMHHVICTIKFTFFAEDGSSIESTLVGEALDTGDKATNKAMAIAYKYACFQVFCIPTSDMADPDAESVNGLRTAGNPPQTQQTENTPAADMRTSRINGEMLRRLQGELARTGVQEVQINNTFKVGKISDLTVEQYNKAMRRLQKTPNRQSGPRNIPPQEENLPGQMDITDYPGAVPGM